MLEDSRRTSTVVSALNRERRWLSKLGFVRSPRPADLDRQANVIAGCVRILSQSPNDYSAWMRRRDRLNHINQAGYRFGHANTVKALLALVDLAIADLAAWPKSAGGLPVRLVDPGALDIPEQKPSQASLGALAKAREAQRRDREAFGEMRRERTMSEPEITPGKPKKNKGQK